MSTTKYGLGLFGNSNNYSVKKPLHRACKACDYNRVEELLKSGESPNELDGNNTPLQILCLEKGNGLIELLINAGADVNCNGISPIFDAISCDNIIAIRKLIEHKVNLKVVNRDGDNPLTYAFFLRNIGIIICLIEEGGMDPLIPDANERTVYNMIDNDNYPNIVSRIHSEYSEVAGAKEFLIECYKSKISRNIPPPGAITMSWK